MNVGASVGSPSRLSREALEICSKLAEGNFAF